jgi:hypothetical protein
MNVPPRRTLRIAALTTVLAATGAAVAIGFRSGWLTTKTSSEYPVGRLRPADLTAEIIARPEPGVTTTEPVIPNAPKITNPVNMPATTTLPGSEVEDRGDDDD